MCVFCVSETNVPLVCRIARYNNETGESTYEYPGLATADDGGGVAGGGGGAEGGGQQGGWDEHADAEGNPYWHNAATGESTYDSPL
jgi:hypothetical protein